MLNTDKTINFKKIGLFDSGIGGFSILSELFKSLPEAEYFYISDDAHAPYGPKSDEFITNRSIEISKQLMSMGVELIVVACNTATAASIDALRSYFPNFAFVGVEPYLNAYYKIPDSLAQYEKKMMVLTTVSTGKSERFKRLKEKLDPKSEIDHYGLPNLAKIIEDFYYDPNDFNKFSKKIDDELLFLKNLNYSYAILGCTHYPLVKKQIEKSLNLKAISPCAHVANRVVNLLNVDKKEVNHDDFFYFLSTKNNNWIKQKRGSILGPFQG